MNEQNFWINILNEIKDEKTVILICIIHKKGSAPNVPGAKLFVSEEKILGTVGGGVSEYKLIEIAKNKLLENDLSIEQILLEHTENAKEHKSGMICSGSQIFVLLPLGIENKQLVKQIIEAYTKTTPGVLTINKNGIEVDFEKKLATENLYFEKGQFWEYQERIGEQNKLFCIGGGHVSLALSKIMQTLDFHITVLDDRENLVTLDSNTFANQKLTISYEDIGKYIPEGDNIYIVIMTYGHKSDEMILQKIIDKNVRYLGMMASRAKKKQVFENLENKGISEEMLEKIHCPIGVKIKSDTPEEIAISIAAEIVLIKNT